MRTEGAGGNAARRGAARGAGLGPVLLAAFLSSGAALAQQGQPPGQPAGQPAQRPATPQPTQEKQFPLGQAWTATTLNGRPLGGERPTLLVDDQLRGKGFAGCNTWSATTYPLREQSFAVGPVAVTRRACANDVMAAERAFLVALRGSRKWDIVAGVLVLTGVNGELRFERAL